LKKIIITVDGTAGSGKQRISKYIAKKYNLFHLDSGILYRRLSKMILNKKIQYDNSYKLNQFISSIKSLSARNHKTLRKESIGKIASKIAVNLKIREFINKQQRSIIKNIHNSYKGAVIDGRDIGSKVFKEAKIKLFIKVRPEIRSKRRHKQLIEQGEKSIHGEILKEIKLRDKADINRKESPLQIPKNAILIDNSGTFLNTIKQINQKLTKI
tara:strand:+ start:161 stop:799 length:639 start_codon:yes stop_codon:yes gene_type:complete